MVTWGGKMPAFVAHTLCDCCTGLVHAKTVNQAKFAEVFLTC